ncbi:GTP-binding protein Rho1, partial [Nowakowskiella sp. JEL0078]
MSGRSGDPLRKKLVVVGDGGCGKTCLLTRFNLGYFPQDYAPTVFETLIKEYVVNDKLIELELWDTAGQEEFGTLRKISYKSADVILLIFSIDNPSSLENVVSV